MITFNEFVEITLINNYKYFRSRYELVYKNIFSYKEIDKIK